MGTLLHSQNESKVHNVGVEISTTDLVRTCICHKLLHQWNKINSN